MAEIRERYIFISFFILHVYETAGITVVVGGHHVKTPKNQNRVLGDIADPLDKTLLKWRKPFYCL